MISYIWHQIRMDEYETAQNAMMEYLSRRSKNWRSDDWCQIWYEYKRAEEQLLIEEIIRGGE